MNTQPTNNLVGDLLRLVVTIHIRFLLVTISTGSELTAPVNSHDPFFDTV